MWKVIRFLQRGSTRVSLNHQIAKFKSASSADDKPRDRTIIQLLNRKLFSQSSNRSVFMLSRLSYEQSLKSFVVRNSLFEFSGNENLVPFTPFLIIPGQHTLDNVKQYYISRLRRQVMMLKK